MSAKNAKNIAQSLLKLWEFDNFKDALIKELENQLIQLNDSTHSKKAYLKIGRIKTKKDLILLIAPLLRDCDCEQYSIKTTDKESSSSSSNLILVLDNIASAYNVGQILRTANFFSIKEVCLIGYTVKADNLKVQKTSLLRPDQIQVKEFEGYEDCFEYLRAIDYQIISVETSNEFSILQQSKVSKNTAYVLGNEKHGLSDELISQTDSSITIEGYGSKNSLNVGNCAAILCYHYSCQFPVNS